jgi:hypothetical protein
VVGQGVVDQNLDAVGAGLGEFRDVEFPGRGEAVAGGAVVDADFHTAGDVAEVKPDLAGFGQGGGGAVPSASGVA